MHRIRVPDDVAALLRSLHPGLKKKARAALRLLSADPLAGKALRDDLEGLRSYRVGRFRIIYRISVKKILEIIAVGPRKIIYEETLRLLKRASGRKP
jgi:mRNA interferase RelE/StbE